MSTSETLNTGKEKLDNWLHQKNYFTDVLEKIEQKTGVKRIYQFLGNNGFQPRPQGFSLKKWVGREKALASAGHVYSLNIPEKLIYMQPAGFALTEGSNNGK